jgi:hypothetical protein
MPVVKPVLAPVVAILSRTAAKGASFGIGEVINLSVTVMPNTANVATFGGVRWAIKNGVGCTLGAVNTGLGTAQLTIGATPGTIELAAYGVNNNATLLTKKITAVAPNDVVFTKIGTVDSRQGVAEAGFIAQLSLLPSGVSFQNVEIREGKFKGKGVGSLADGEGDEHPDGAWLGVVCNPVTGSNLVQGHDMIHSGAGVYPFTDSKFEWYIPWLYHLIGGLTETTFVYCTHKETINAMGRVTIEKHNSGVYGASLNDPTNTYNLLPIGYP